MILGWLLAIFGLAWLAGRRRWRRLAWALGLAGVALLLATACGPLPSYLLRAWQWRYAERPSPAWAPSNAIVLLTANASNPPAGEPEPGVVGYTRVAETLALYRDCRAHGAHCTVLVSGGSSPSLDGSLSAAYGNALRALGLPAADLMLETRSRTTWQNAQFSAPILHQLHADKVWLVSSAVHLRRGMFAFRHFGVAALPVRADYLRVNVLTWPSAANLEATDRVLHEIVGMVWYRVLARRD